MDVNGQIDLTSVGPFRIGPITVEPALRQVSTTTTLSETLEPRVMQVLVVLVRANGAVVSRDALVDQCWEGRIVGDDSINRVISRLRRLSEERGNGSFRIETITKIGYRLIGDVVPVPAPTPVAAEADPDGTASRPPPGPAAAGAARPPSPPAKRLWLTVPAAMAIALLALAGWHTLHPEPKPLPAKLRIGEFVALSPEPPVTLAAALRSELQRRFGSATSQAITLVRTPPSDTAQAYVLAGTIRRTGDSLHYLVNLSREGSGETPLSLTFDRPASAGETSLADIVGHTSEAVTCTLNGAVGARTVPLPDPTLALWARYCGIDPDLSADRGRAYGLVTLREAVRANPDFATGWAELADLLGSDIPDAERAAGHPAFDEAMAALATARGLGLDTDAMLNARARLLPIRAVAEREALLRESAHRFAIASNGGAPFNYGNFLWNVGRIEDALVQNKLAIQVNASEEPLWSRIQMLRWAGRKQEADAMIAKFDAESPEKDVGRFARLEDALSSGDLAAAEAAIAGSSRLHPQAKAALLDTLAALRSGDPAARAAAASRLLAVEAGKETRTPLAIDALAALGRDADALDAARSFIFGPMVPSTKFLFRPALARARALPAFAGLAGRFGLTNYWRRTAKLPDFCAAGEATAFCATLRR